MDVVGNGQIPPRPTGSNCEYTGGRQGFRGSTFYRFENKPWTSLVSTLIVVGVAGVLSRPPHNGFPVCISREIVRVGGKPNPQAYSFQRNSPTGTVCCTGRGKLLEPPKTQPA
ncbi:hypothetical protein Bbelb_028980 [Branchiostoma belcheri]|nr:hypothetical protein Bbelb_028980 [Branchiostoma belcheri]